ncbi:interleukin-31 receptor subunit alpha [Chaetodon trifascialis]|uniref:interleukin-31 receptor subunit alpha n=1 Tax=Chaetodon trifascialis TaxID=109706 RepID=UPI003996B7E6
MAGCAAQLDVSDPKCSSYASHSHIFILVNCKPTDISLKYQHCGIHPDGVHDLDCFGKYSALKKTCVWKPGKHASEKTFTLIIQQQSKNYCKAHINITDISANIKLYENFNMTAEVFENVESENCTKAAFRGSPKSLLRCGPPSNVSFSRHSGRLDVNVGWQNVDQKVIKYYSVRYKPLGSLPWSESPVQSQNGATCTVENLNSSLVYAVQIQCVNNKKCTQCVWSEAYTVPAELTSQPVIVSFEDTDIAERKGRRRLSLTWKFPAKELHDGYDVSVGKASGEEPCERMSISQPQITLILSHSAYHLNISAVNNASTSPAVSQTIPQREDEPSTAAGKLNVTVHSNTSFTIYWEDILIKTYVCYSVEWAKKGHKAAYMSFYQNVNNHRTLSPLPEPLEPYTRYSITLHTRPNKDTCNMKHVNNSESTYGSVQFYFTEGSPVSAPTNINSYNVTQDSAALQWASIPEDDVRGFLRGYVIHYAVYDHRGPSTERNITVDPDLTNYKLTDLESGTAYKVQISGFTQAGAGVRSTASLFKTNPQGYSNISRVIAVFAVVFTVLIFGSPIIKRGKVILWPSIPNPGDSSAIQKIEGPFELELLESINTLKVEEWDTNSLQVVENQDVIPAGSSPSMPLLLHAAEDEEDSPEMTCSELQTDTKDVSPEVTTGTFSDIQRTDLHSSAFAFQSGYTTMEMFQQMMPQGVAANTAVTQESEPEEMDGLQLTAMKSGLHYVRQFSTSPILNNDDMSTIL